MHSAHHARDTVDLVSQETRFFISPDLWHPNIQDIQSVLQGLGYHATSCLPDKNP